MESPKLWDMKKKGRKKMLAKPASLVGPEQRVRDVHEGGKKKRIKKTMTKFQSAKCDEKWIGRREKGRRRTKQREIVQILPNRCTAAKCVHGMGMGAAAGTGQERATEWHRSMDG